MLVMFIVTFCSLKLLLFSVLRVKMEEAMRRGVSELDVTTVMASGIPGSGKTIPSATSCLENCLQKSESALHVWSLHSEES